MSSGYKGVVEAVSLTQMFSGCVDCELNTGKGVEHRHIYTFGRPQN
jgi:hypothetical protein